MVEAEGTLGGYEIYRSIVKQGTLTGMMVGVFNHESLLTKVFLLNFLAMEEFGVSKLDVRGI